MAGVSGTSASHCLGVGRQEASVIYGGITYQSVGQAITGSSDARRFTGSPLALTSGVYRGGSGPPAPSTVLTAIACAPTDRIRARPFAASASSVRTRPAPMSSRRAPVGTVPAWRHST